MNSVYHILVVLFAVVLTLCAQYQAIPPRNNRSHSRSHSETAGNIKRYLTRFLPRSNSKILASSQEIKHDESGDDVGQQQQQQRDEQTVPRSSNNTVAATSSAVQWGARGEITQRSGHVYDGNNMTTATPRHENARSDVGSDGGRENIRQNEMPSPRNDSANAQRAKSRVDSGRGKPHSNSESRRPPWNTPSTTGVGAGQGHRQTTPHSQRPPTSARSRQAAPATGAAAAERPQTDAGSEQQLQREPPRRRQQESAVELVKNAATSSLEAGISTAKLVEHGIVNSLSLLNEHMAKPDMKKMADLAVNAVSTTGSALVFTGKVVKSTATHLCPPLVRIGMRYVFPTIWAFCCNTVPIGRALKNTICQNGQRLKPYIGRVAKPALRKGRKFVVKPAYNRLLLPAMQHGAKKVLEWSDWPESNSEREDNGDDKNAGLAPDDVGTSGKEQGTNVSHDDIFEQLVGNSDAGTEYNNNNNNNYYDKSRTPQKRRAGKGLSKPNSGNEKEDNNNKNDAGKFGNGKKKHVFDHDLFDQLANSDAETEQQH